MGLNALLELDEEDPDNHYLTQGLKYYLAELESATLYIVALAVLFVIGICIMFWESLIKKVLKLFS